MRPNVRVNVPGIGIGQTGVIFAALAIAWIIFITMRGELKRYMQVLGL